MGSKSVSLIPAAEEEQKDNGAGKLQSAASWNFVTARIQKLDTEAPRDGPKTHMATATNPWKGSVVDSVIGVFLTQNVSDHLSR